MNFSIKRLICFVVLLGAAASGAFGQAKAEPGTADAKAEEAILPGAAYDVATIKPHKPSDSGGIWTLPSGEFQSVGMPLKNAVEAAYGKFDFEILGSPAWLESDKYDLAAKPDSSVAEQLQRLTPAQREKVQERMLQALLEDRLKLKEHRETRQMPIFALVVAKGGSRLHELKPGDADTKGMGAGSWTVGNGKMVARGISMDNLAEQLTDSTDHIVLNQTGLKGMYDFTLRYTDDVEAGPDSSAPSIYTALQEQLGLKLESTKGPVEVLVIDHVERPSEN